jgi:hypothetical protein
MKLDGRFIMFSWHGMEWKSFYNGVCPLHAAPVTTLPIPCCSHSLPTWCPNRNDSKMCRSSVHKIRVGLFSNNCVLPLLPATLGCSCTVELFTQPWLMEGLVCSEHSYLIYFTEQSSWDFLLQLKNLEK